MAGHIVAVVGGKGGGGTRFFAANLAIAYLQVFKARPLVVDLDMTALGAQNTFRGLTPPKTIVELSKLQGAPIDAKSIGPFLANAQAGFSFIGAPKDAILAR